MSTERKSDGWDRLAAVHAALADATRLRIVERLGVSDTSSSELGAWLGAPSNLVAHHLKVLEHAGLVTRRPSEGDRRRGYLVLDRAAFAGVGVGATPGTPFARPRRVVFVCTANSARSQLAATLWREVSDLPVVSAGTHPAARVDDRAAAVAARHGTPLAPDVVPRLLDQTWRRGDLMVTVCDRAHEELGGGLETLHWSVPDPVLVGTKAAFGQAYRLLDDRVRDLAPRLRAVS